MIELTYNVNMLYFFLHQTWETCGDRDGLMSDYQYNQQEDSHFIVAENASNCWFKVCCHHILESILFVKQTMF